MRKKDCFVIASPSDELFVVARVKGWLRPRVQWQIQVRGILMAEGVGVRNVSDALLNVANDLEIHNLVYAASECRVLASAMDIG